MAQTPADTANESSDDQLLLSIAQDRDQAAFAELYRRFAQLGFNVAINITGNRALAEEALQEAMMQVWLSAKSYQPGNARGWILRIVARESLELARKQAKERKRMDSELSGEDSRGAAGFSENVEHGEMLFALRRVVQELPALDRQLIALHFGAGLTQQEIGAALSIPQQTISFKIKKVLDDLRGRLSVAGFAAAAPLVSAEFLSKAICGGLPAPHGLSARLLAKLATKSRALRAVPRSTSKAAGTLPKVGVLAAVATLACGVWFVTQSPKTKPVASAPPAASPTVKAEDGQVSRRWSFDAGIPADFESQIGTGTHTWQWKKTPRGGELFADFTIALTLPVKTPNRPFVVTAHYDFKDYTGDTFGAVLWRDDHATIPYSAYAKKVSERFQRTGLPDVIEVSVYFNKQTTVQMINGAVFRVSQTEKQYPTDTVCLVLKNCGLLSAEYRTLTDSEIPADIADSAKVIERLTAGGAVKQDIPAYRLGVNWMDEK